MLLGATATLFLDRAHRTEARQPEQTLDDLQQYRLTWSPSTVADRNQNACSGAQGDRDKNVPAAGISRPSRIADRMAATTSLPALIVLLRSVPRAIV